MIKKNKKKSVKDKVAKRLKPITEKIFKEVSDSTGADIETECVTINDVTETGLGTLKGTICINIELCGGRVFDGIVDFEIDEEVAVEDNDEENDEDERDNSEEDGYDEEEEK